MRQMRTLKRAETTHRSEKRHRGNFEDYRRKRLFFVLTFTFAKLAIRGCVNSQIAPSYKEICTSDFRVNKYSGLIVAPRETGPRSRTGVHIRGRGHPPRLGALTATGDGPRGGRR